MWSLVYKINYKISEIDTEKYKIYNSTHSNLYSFAKKHKVSTI